MATISHQEVEEMRGVLRNRKETLEGLDEMLAKVTKLRDEEMRGIAILEYQLRLVDEVPLK